MGVYFNDGDVQMPKDIFTTKSAFTVCATNINNPMRNELSNTDLWILDTKPHYTTEIYLVWHKVIRINFYSTVHEAFSVIKLY